MSRRSAARLLLLPGIVAVTYACNVYTEDLLHSEEAGAETGGESTGAMPASGGYTGGRSSSGATGGLATGGMTSGDAGTDATGGNTPADGGDTSEGGTPGSGGNTPTGGATGGGNVGGASSGGTESGGARTGGADNGGVPTGGAAAGAGAPTGGAQTGGADNGGAGGVASGGVPTGGAATGGAPTGGSLPVGETEVDLLDVANNTIELSNGEGFWYVFHDDSAGATITPDTQNDSSLKLVPVALPAERDGNLLGVHVVADDGFTAWGAGVGFDLNSPNSTTRNPYDLTPYTGIIFWARSAAGSVDMRLRVVTADVTPDTSPGGECATNCDDVFGDYITLTTQWQEFTVEFAAPPLEQQGWGYEPPAFDPTGALAIQLQADAGIAFDIWLDDIRFYE